MTQFKYKKYIYTYISPYNIYFECHGDINKSERIFTLRKKTNLKKTP